MSTTDDTGSTGPAVALVLRPEVVISAAGGLDAIATEVAEQQVTVLGDDFDSGHPDLNGALWEFAQRWTQGMQSLVARQQDRANGLRKVATDIVGTDVDQAYASEVARQGLDFV